MELIEKLRFEEVSVALALVYLVLAIRQSLWCWPATLVSAALMAFVVLDTGFYMGFALQIFYFAMAIYGWQQWRSGGERVDRVRVHRWTLERHAIVLTLIVLASVLVWLALRQTQAVYPFLDSLTAVASVVTTFMVARKVIENWIYWFVVDAILVYVSFMTDLDWYALLYAVYLVMVVFGFRSWLESLREDRAADANLAR